MGKAYKFLFTTAKVFLPLRCLYILTIPWKITALNFLFVRACVRVCLLIVLAFSYCV